MHDNEQVGRLFDLNASLFSGQFPVRILPNLGFGYGYPLFNFYPPLVYYIAEIFKIIGFSYIVSIKIMILLGFVFSFIFMYLFTKEHYGKMAGIISAVAYTYAPYHSVDVYVRGALPESWGFVFVPAIFWSLLKLKQTLSNKYVALLAIFSALLVLAHNLVAIMSALFIAIYFVFLLWQSKKREKFLKKGLSSALLGILLSAFFWMPSLLEKKYTAVNLLTIELANYNGHFVCIRQFLFSKWGFSGSVPGCADGLSFSLGVPQLILASIVGVLTVLLFKKAHKYKEIPLFIILLLLTLFLQTHYSKFIWDLLPGLSYIQFPWRFLLLTAFFIALLAASLLIFTRDRNLKLIIFFASLISIIYFNHSYFRPEKYFPSATDVDYTNTTFIRWDTSSLAAEYVPSDVLMTKTKFGNTAIDISKEEIATSSYKILSGEMIVKVLEEKPQAKSFEVSVLKKGLFQPQIFSFPGWRVMVNGKTSSYTKDNKFRLITLPLSKGEHKVEVVFENTPVRNVANILSIIGAIGIVSLLIL